MSVFLNPDDEANLFVRLLFNRELGREPAAGEQQAWVAHLRDPRVGADLCTAHLRDQPEAANFRAKRGW